MRFLSAWPIAAALVCGAAAEPIAKPVAIARVARVARTAVEIRVIPKSGPILRAASLRVDPNGNVSIGDQGALRCEAIAGIELTSMSRSAGSRVAEWAVTGAGGALSIAAGVAVHPAFFAGAPAALFAGRKIAKRSLRRRTLHIAPVC